jgi:hypothetical protein
MKAGLKLRVSEGGREQMGLGNLLERGKKLVVQLFTALNQLRAYWFIIISQIPFLQNSASKK